MLTRAVILLILASFGGYWQDGQPVKADGPRTASVSGTVTMSGNPLAGAQVVLIPDDAQGREGTRRAKTDQDGHYLLDSLKSGYYTIQVVAPGVAVQGHDQEGQGARRLTVQEAAKLENINFALVPGGVITGRVVDSDGSPIPDLSPSLKLMDDKGRSTWFSPIPQESRTDDRGIYRIYGLPPGRYLIAFGIGGDGPDHFHNDIFLARGPYPVTYYPGAPDEADAKIIEVTPGREVAGIDISLTKKSLFKASGTVVDQDSGLPIAGAVVSHWIFSGGYPAGPVGSVRSDSEGRFKFDRLQTGKHSVKLYSSNAGNSFSNRVTFDVVDGDVDGLEVKVYHGLAISGTIVPASPSDEKLIQAIREVHAIKLGTSSDNGTPSMDQAAQSPVAAGGTFRLAGLAPGKYKLQLANNEGGFCILYIEVPGIGRMMNRAGFPPGSFEGDPIEIAEGQTGAEGQNHDPPREISGVRITIATASSVIHGQIKVEGGTLPEGALAAVSVVMLPASDHSPYAGAQVDADGRFVIRSLVPGQYLIRAAAYTNPPMNVLARASETVSIADGQDASVTLTLKLAPPPK